MPIEFRKAAQRDATRAELLRRAAKFIEEQDRMLCEAGNEARTLAASFLIWDLNESAKEAQEDVLVEFEDTQPQGIRIDEQAQPVSRRTRSYR